MFYCASQSLPALVNAVQSVIISIPPMPISFLFNSSTAHTCTVRGENQTRFSRVKKSAKRQKTPPGDQRREREKLEKRINFNRVLRSNK